MKTTLLLGVLALAAGAACSSSSTHDTADASSDAAKGDTSKPPETCPPRPSLTCANEMDPPSYKKDIVPIIDSRCSPCHFPGGISFSIDNLTNYTDVANAGTAILNQIPTCLMPPIHGNTMYGIQPGTVPGLTAEQLDTFVDWIACGAPDN